METSPLTHDNLHLEPIIRVNGLPGGEIVGWGLPKRDLQEKGGPSYANNVYTRALDHYQQALRACATEIVSTEIEDHLGIK